MVCHASLLACDELVSLHCHQAASYTPAQAVHMDQFTALVQTAFIEPVGKSRPLDPP